MTIDTNVYSALARGLTTAANLIDDTTEITIPLPVIAELRYGFKKGSKTEHNEQTLQKFLAQPQVSIAIPSMKTTDIYSDLQLYCSNKGRVLSHNDLWIAALSRELESKLVTFDKDFSVLKDIFDS